MIQEEKKRSLSDADLVDLHHNFMVVYGWIPLEEFKALPLSTLNNLYPKVCEELNRLRNYRYGMLKSWGAKQLKFGDV